VADNETDIEEPEVDESMEPVEVEKTGRPEMSVLPIKPSADDTSVQVDLLASHIDSCKYPVFLCGDFNDTPVSYAYRSLRGNLNDAFLECGPRGMGKTYNGPFPSFRIDYILFPDGYDAAGFKVLGRSYSDHFPVSCRFKKEE